MPTGILLLDKPRGLSSNRALQRVRKRLSRRQAPATWASLDPMATGMLPLCRDAATKVIAEIESGAQELSSSRCSSARAPTPATPKGDVVEELAGAAARRRAAIEAAADARFAASSQQVPPMYSALKREGRPLYRLAR